MDLGGASYEFDCGSTLSDPMDQVQNDGIPMGRDGIRSIAVFAVVYSSLIDICFNSSVLRAMPSAASPGLGIRAVWWWLCGAGLAGLLVLLVFGCLGYSSSLLKHFARFLGCYVHVISLHRCRSFYLEPNAFNLGGLVPALGTVGDQSI